MPAFVEVWQGCHLGYIGLAGQVLLVAGHWTGATLSTIISASQVADFHRQEEQGQCVHRKGKLLTF